ncbi:MAG: deoxyribodipyrimidine photo-lyase [Acholeplasmataceae bacterium]|nr:deoxyribodipyrimidine photo-lyase [Acholeplasmataceae bacterium]
MNSKRLIHLKDGKSESSQKYVIYWMQQSHRVHYNHALNYAIEIANQKNLPLLVYFGLTPNYPEANQRHYYFMLEGLQEVKTVLEKFHIHFLFKLESPEKGIKQYLKDAAALVMDYGYLRLQKLWRKEVLDYALENDYNLSIDIIDTDLIVPVRVASDKAEYGAYTLRPKIKRLYLEFRDFSKIETIKNQKLLIFESDNDLTNIQELIDSLDIDKTVSISPIYRGGYIQASKMFYDFIENKANRYIDSNDPSLGLTSKMSMYLHFGQISALEIMDKMFLLIDQGNLDGASFDAYIEQLLVRRELAFNFVTYNKGYDQFEKMTEPWAYMTMNEHEFDKRDYLYSLKELENAKTHDPYFNAAMDEMFYTGYMHNYMRMYWAKKIIEWMPTYKEAYDTTLYLNNKYFIDGRDPNSYTGIAWCFGKHDRAWTERNVFGKLRYMNAKGLERKFNIDGYVKDVETMVKNTINHKKSIVKSKI